MASFFFYGLGHVRMGTYKFSSWAIHMIMLVLLSAMAGLVMKEWRGCSKPTLQLLALAIFVLITAVLLLTYGVRSLVPMLLLFHLDLPRQISQDLQQGHINFS